MVVTGEMFVDFAGGFIKCIVSASDLGFGTCDSLLALHASRFNLEAMVFVDDPVLSQFGLDGGDGFLVEPNGVFGKGFDFHDDLSLFDKRSFAEIGFE